MKHVQAAMGTVEGPCAPFKCLKFTVTTCHHFGPARLVSNKYQKKIPS